MAGSRKRVADRIAIDLHLHYVHPLGSALGPYFDGLKQGQARARRCPICNRTWFPPRPLCPYDRHDTDWITLNGGGRIVSITSAISRLPLSNAKAQYCFALVAVDGADNAAFARVLGETAALVPGARVRLVAASGEVPHPAQCACFILDAP